MTLVPDRRDDGTNVLAVPTGVGFRFAYGAGLVRPPPGRGRPARAARSRIVRDAVLGWDVDVPADLDCRRADRPPTHPGAGRRP